MNCPLTFFSATQTTFHSTCQVLSKETIRLIRRYNLLDGLFARHPNFQGLQIVPIERVATWNTPLGRSAYEIAPLLTRDFSRLSQQPEYIDDEFSFLGPLPSEFSRAEGEYQAAFGEFTRILGLPRF
ncbi:hypothetical protein [Deinococcus cavernae]|uniref:hypothetical protein n=1 Tax=Deinococcus cavernae TaxID=2320857 RepID=UPI0011C2110D|nr:hypothetical protein [Deinococcus cavernae]